MNKYIKEFLCLGKNLEPYDIYGYAFLKEVSLKILTDISESEVLILGGDVYYFEDEKLRSSGDNWYWKDNEKESYNENCIRSHKISYDYIKNYRSEDFIPYFVFVFDEPHEVDDPLGKLGIRGSGDPRSIGSK